MKRRDLAIYVLHVSSTVCTGSGYSSRNIQRRTLLITHVVVITTVVTIKVATVVFAFVITRIAYITVTLIVQKLSLFGPRLTGSHNGSQL
jgi:hypothetical protein